MKNIVVILMLVLGIVSCKQKQEPKNIIDEQKMIKVLVDMQITDAYLSQVYQPDTQKMQANSRYNYIFKKHKIDSAKFSNSLKYYSLDAKKLDEMYTMVDDSLTRLEKSLMPKQKKVKRVRKIKKVEHDLPVQ